MSEFSCDSESDYEDKDGPAPHVECLDEATTVFTPKIKSMVEFKTASMELYLKLSKGVVVHKN